MDELTKLSDHPRTTVRRPGAPDPEGACVVYWMQRAQRGIDNPALDVAVEAANILKKPVVVFLGSRAILSARESAALSVSKPRHS